MAETLSTYILESARAAEVYLTAAPPPDAPLQQQLEDIFGLAAEALRRQGGRVFQERVFVPADAVERAAGIRSRAYGDLADGVGPSVLLSPSGAAGLQLHAVRCDAQPAAVGGDTPVGRVLRMGEFGQLALSGVSADASAPPADQARTIHQNVDALLASAGAGMQAVPRTWWWLGDILAWYDDFNAVRNAFFAERGLTGGESAPPRMPASTGIGVAPAGGAACALDLLAVVGAGTIEYQSAAGRQRSAYAYGSAFSRAARARTAGGETVWVSGTAAIDATGATVHAGDARAQIEVTLGNVRAVLADHDCADGEVVAAIAYCKTPEVEAAWRRIRPDVPWPFVTVLADVCRQDLLFEVEATACPGVQAL